MAEPIRIAVEFTGTDDAVRGTTRVSDGLENMSARSSAAARTTDQLAARQTAAATAAIAFGQRLAAAANAIQGVTSALGVEGQVAGLIGRVTQTSAAMAQLGASFGPQGALVGGILGAAIPAIQYMSQQLNEQEQRIVDLRSAADGLVTSYDDILARMNQVNSERARGSRLGMGLGSETEQRAFLESAENRAEQTRLEAQAAFLALQEASTAEYAEAAANLRTAEEAEGTARRALQSAQEGSRLAAEEARGEIDQLMEELMSAGTESAAPAARRGGGRRVAAREEGAPSGPSEAERMYAEMIAEENAALESQADLTRYLMDLREEAMQQQEQAAAARAEQHEAELERQAELKDSLIESADKQREVADRQRQEYMGVTSVIAGGLNDALQAIIAGNKTAEEAFTGLLASFLKYISEQSMLKAIYEYAEAIASFASYKYDQGAQHLAAGIAYTAVAVAAGAGAAALSAPSAKGSSEEKPASPESGRGDGGGGGGDIVINWNSPVVTAGTRAELGRDMAGIIRAGTQRYGTV